ncbi:MAG: hypothetical protein HYS44_02580 [Candidatus Niyogibacteria bacterium]|nr:hypothetical protein [Candidatus Niyogibacteria bacterium]
MRTLVFAVLMVLVAAPHTLACGFFGSEAERQEAAYNALFGSRAWLKQFPWVLETTQFSRNLNYAGFELTREKPRANNDSRHSGVIVYAYSPTAEVNTVKGERVTEVYVIAFIVVRENRVEYRAIARGYLDSGTMSGTFERYDGDEDLAKAVLDASERYPSPLSVVSSELRERAR